MRTKTKILCLAIGVAMGLPLSALAAKTGGSFRATLDTQVRSNTNIQLAPSSNGGFQFASLKDFAEDESEGGGEADDEEEGDDDFEFDDIEGDDYDQVELEESDNPDEDGDGIDDLIDDDQDGGDGGDDGDDDDDDDDDDEGGNAPDGGKAAKATRSSKTERATVKFGVGHKYVFSDLVSYQTGVKLSLDRQPDRSDLNKLNAAFTTGPEFKLSDRTKLKFGANYVRLQQDSENFLSTWVGVLGFDFDYSKKLGFGAKYNYQDKDVTDPDSPDAIVNTFTIEAELKPTKHDIFKFGYSPTVEDSSITTRNKDTSGFEITYSRKLPWNTVMGIGFKRDNVEYVNLPRAREDDVTSYALQFETEITKAISASLAYDYRELDSNINSKDGENRSIVFNLGFKF